MSNDLGTQLVESMKLLDETQTLACSVDMLKEGHSSFVIFERLLEGIREVDGLYEAGQYFIADLIMAGHIMKSVMNKVLVFNSYEEFGSFGKIIIATVKDDIHELGKNVIADVLRHNGFEVLDLGADTSAERLIDAARDYHPNILILSGTLSSSPGRMAESIAALARTELRHSMCVIVGGSSVTDQAAKEMGADAYSSNIMDCLKACHECMAVAASMIGEN